MKQDEYPEEIKALLKFGKQRRQGPMDQNSNPTLPLELVEIIHTPTECEDCGLRVVDRHIDIKKNTQPIAYWRKECSICKQCEHPITKDFSLNSVELRVLLRSLHSVAATPGPGPGRPIGVKNKPKNKNIDK